jgi:hypothetical protein
MRQKEFSPWPITCWDSRLVAIDGHVVQIAGHDENVTTFEADTVLVAGRRPLRPAFGALRSSGLAIYDIGDCIEPRGMGEALEEGRKIAEMIA